MENWKSVTIGEIAKLNTTSYSEKEKWEYVNYLDTGSIVENKISSIQYFDTRNDNVPSRAKRKVRKNSIVYSTVRPNQLHYGIIKEMPENFLVSTGFTVISAAIAWWKNNSFTQSALKADEVMKEEKANGRG